MLQIWNIEQPLQEVFNEIEENEGDLTPELEEKLMITRENMSDKLYQIDKMRKIASKDLDMIKDEQLRLAEMVDKRIRFIENIDTIITTTVERFGGTDEKSKAKHKPKVISFDLGEAKVSYSEAVELDEFDKDYCPEELEDYAIGTVTIKNRTVSQAKVLQNKYDECEIKISISKSDVKKAIENGEEFESARIKVNKKIAWK
jgi:recombinational DNA repair ATPase RecF